MRNLVTIPSIIPSWLIVFMIISDIIFTFMNFTTPLSLFQYTLGFATVGTKPFIEYLSRIHREIQTVGKP